MDLTLHSARPWTDEMADEPALLRQVLNTLSREEQLVCIWKIAGFSSEQIAQYYGRSPTSIDAVFVQAIRKLRRALDER